MEKMPRQDPRGDLAIVAGEVTLQAIPVVGNALAAVFGKAARDQYELRMSNWLETLGESVTRLEQKLEDLANDPEFIDTVMSATAAAGKTLHAEKLEALKNAVLNSADPESRPGEDLRLRFIGIVEQMVPDHLRLMNYFQSPKQWFDQRPDISLPTMTTTNRGLVALAMRWDKSQEQRMDRLLEDLMTWRILGVLHRSNGSLELINSEHLTADGKEFMTYIQLPADLSADKGSSAKI
ncbi:hypothetical protein [Glutamicibacter arilaitensis]|uniref:hypothetical protein n=1 Tax=Glutamicibacter arilaitensis TaxID=256701 RepID=UPI003F911906